MRIACLLLFLPLIGLTQPNASGQETPAAIKPLTIGDTVPDLVLENMVNFPIAIGTSSSARLSDFKGKLLILDFWATYCTSCIKKLPVLDSLQQQFSSHLQVLLVSPLSKLNSEERVCTIIEKRKTPGSQPYRLPAVINDTILNRFFPHKAIPYYILIDSSGTIQDTFTGDELNIDVIKNLLLKAN